MKKIGMILGIIGGLAGLIRVYTIMGFGFSSYGPGLVNLSIISVLAIIVALFAGKFSKVAGAILVILGILGIVLLSPTPWIGAINIVAGILVLIGAFMKKTDSASQV